MNESGPFSGANADNETKFSDSGELLVTDGDEQVYLAASNTASTPSDNPADNESPPFIGTDNESPTDGESTPRSPFDDIKNVSEAFALLEAAQREENYIEMRLSLAAFQAEFMMQETAEQLQMIAQIGDQQKELEDKIKKYVPKTRWTVFRGPSAPVQRRASTPLQSVVYWRSSADNTVRRARSRRDARERLQKEHLEEEIFTKDAFRGR
jgi:hypothetical protein